MSTIPAVAGYAAMSLGGRTAAGGTDGARPSNIRAEVRNRTDTSRWSQGGALLGLCGSRMSGWT